MNEDISFETMKKIAWGAAVVVLTAAAILFFYPFEKKKAPASAPPNQKEIDKQKIMADIELIKKGYVKSLAGKIEEISPEKDKIVVDNDSINLSTGETDKFSVVLGRKTSFFKVSYVQKEPEDGADVSEEDEGAEPLTEKILSASQKEDLEKGDQVEIIFPEFVLLEAGKDFLAEKVEMIKKAEE